MSEKLELIKQLRAKGATIRMVDDVAAYLDANGGYDSPVFVATVEFIIKIRQMLQSVLMQQEQSVGMKTEFGEKDLEETKNVNFDAAKSAVGNDDEIEDYEREKILEHIFQVEAQLDSYIENNNYKENQNLALENKTGKGKKSRDGRRGPGLLERLFKINAAMNAQKKNQQNQLAQTEAGHDAASRIAASRQAQQSVQTVQRSSVMKMNLIKMKLLSSLRMGKDRTVIGQEAWKAKKDGRQINKNSADDNKNDKKPVSEAVANLKASTSAASKNEANSVSKDKRNVNEISISKVIDAAVKASNQEKKPVADQKPPTEKGKFEKKVDDKSGPRADDKKVADMKVQEAIKNLQNSGVKTSSADSKTKKEIDVQISQSQSGGGATPKLQR